MRFGILGPLEAHDGGRRLAVGGPQQRALLAVLLLNANRVVSVDALVQRLWGERPPATARGLLHGCVAALRRVLCTDEGGTVRQPLVTRPPGYLLEVRPGELDRHRVEELEAAAGRELAGQTRAALERAAELLAEALSLWRGPVLDDVPSEVCGTEATRLEESQLTLLERRVDVDLRLGRFAELAGELQARVRQQPLRESLWARLILALYCADRQADALAAYRQLRKTLVDQLGIEPAGSLQQLERAVLAGADAGELVRREAGGPVAEADPDGDPDTGPTAGRSVDGGSAVPPVPPPRPAQLPAAVPSFTGRAGPLGELDALLAGRGGTPPGTVVISAIAGTPGVGKTALAVHWAHQVADRFGDGQLYVNLRGYAAAPPVRPVEALAGLLHALGVPPDQAPAELEEAAAMFRTLLAGRRVLLLLDNAAGAEQVRPLLPASPGCLVLVTSRDRLGGLVARDGAAHLSLDALTPDEAQLLLTRLLGEQRVAAEPDAAAALARACGHLPLAVRIAAANLTLHPRRTIAEQVAALSGGDRLAALSVDGDDRAAVRAAFDQSYRALEPGQRLLFRLLSLVPGPDVTPAAAAALAGSTPDQARAQLDGLAAASLLMVSGPGRYALHDLLRLYAAERARDEGDAAGLAVARRQLLDWYLHTTAAAAGVLYPQMLRLPLPPYRPHRSDAGPDAGRATPAGALAWLEAERANLLAAVQHAAAPASGTTAPPGPDIRPVAWLLADALRGYFIVSSRIVDWLAAALAARAAAEAARDLPGQAAAQFSLADAHLCQSKYPAAIELYAQAAATAEQAGWADGQEVALGNLGSAYRSAGQLAEAAEYYVQALASAERTGRLAGQAANHNNLGTVHWDQGRPADAADQHAQALALFRAMGSRAGEAVVLANLGECYHVLGRLDEAIDHLTRALAVHREIGDSGNEPETLGKLAAAHLDAGRPAEALDLAGRAAAAARETGDPRRQAQGLIALASVHAGVGRHTEAAEGFRHALRLARTAGAGYAEVESLTGLAVAYRECGRLDEAAAFGRQALALAADRGFRHLRGQAGTALAGVHLGAGRVTEALACGREALTVHRATGRRPDEARTLVLLGSALHRSGDTGAAEAHRQLAHALFAELGTAEALGDCRG